MRIHIATDHAGLEFSTQLQHHLAAAGHDVVDHGPGDYDPQDDYPPFCLRAGAGVVGDPGSLGIVIGGSGNGEQMAANKVEGARAALAWSLATAELAREHNDANVVAVGARQHSEEEMLEIIDTFIATPFTGAERHARRVAQLGEYETTGAIAGHEIV